MKDREEFDKVMKEISFTLCTRCNLRHTGSNTGICFFCWEKFSAFTQYFILRKVFKEKKECRNHTLIL